MTAIAETPGPLGQAIVDLLTLSTPAAALDPETLLPANYGNDCADALCALFGFGKVLFEMGCTLDFRGQEGAEIFFGAVEHFLGAVESAGFSVHGIGLNLDDTAEHVAGAFPANIVPCRILGFTAMLLADHIAMSRTAGAATHKPLAAYAGSIDALKTLTRCTRDAFPMADLARIAIMSDLYMPSLVHTHVPTGDTSFLDLGLGIDFSQLNLLQGLAWAEGFNLAVLDTEGMPIQMSTFDERCSLIAVRFEPGHFERCVFTSHDVIVDKRIVRTDDADDTTLQAWPVGLSNDSHWKIGDPKVVELSK
jgi:hypothetical protein